MAYLQRVVNGGGFIDRELEQLNGYLERLGLTEGTLILFDGRPQALPLAERCARSETEYQGRRIALLRL